MPSLPQILLGRSWAERDDLRRALAHQKKMGGELSVCLLESGAVSEERLLRALSEQFGVPWVDVDALRHTSKDLAEVLPHKLARRTGSVPFHQVGTALHVAMADPNDLAARDELSFACGRRLHVHISHPARIAEAQQRLYGLEPSSRMAALVDQLNRNRYLWRDGAPQPDGGRETEGRPLHEEGDSLAPPDLPDSLEGLFAPSNPQRARPAPPPRSISLSPRERQQLYGRKGSADRMARKESGRRREAESLPTEPFAAASQRLGVTGERDEVAAIVLDLLASHFLHSALWVVRGDRVEGWRSRGGGLDRDRLQATSLPLSEPSVFLNLASGAPFHLGPLADFPLHREMLAAWNEPRPTSCLVVPVRFHDRLVMALWGDRGEESLTGLGLHRFQTLAEQVAEALERCIRLKKQRMSESGPS